MPREDTGPRLVDLVGPLVSAHAHLPLTTADADEEVSKVARLGEEVTALVLLVLAHLALLACSACVDCLLFYTITPGEASIGLLAYALTGEERGQKTSRSDACSRCGLQGLP